MRSTSLPLYIIVCQEGPTLEGLSQFRSALAASSRVLALRSGDGFTNISRYNKLQTTAQARALRKRRERQRAVVYTLPVNPVAGQEVEVFYNSEATVMRGRPSAWLRGSWNRWTHPQCFVPQRLNPVVKGAPGFATATIEVAPLFSPCLLYYPFLGLYHGIPLTGASEVGEAVGCTPSVQCGRGSAPS
jgi:hypothetical protein